MRIFSPINVIQYDGDSSFSSPTRPFFWNEKKLRFFKMRFSLVRQLEKCKIRLKEKVYSKSDYAEALRKT